MGIRIIKPGPFTTIQDTGRYGFQRYGVPVGGSMDRFAAALAKILCGVSWDAAVLEISFAGTKLFFDEDHLVAFTGGGARAYTEEGEELPLNRTIFIPQFSVIDTRYHPEGSRLYMAIDGGIDVPKVMRSRSTYLPAGINYQLKDKDIYKTLPPSAWAREIMEQMRCKKINAAKWGPKDAMIHYGSTSLRVMQGPEWPMFAEQSHQAFQSKAFVISRASDRMGFRFDQPGEALTLHRPHEMISTAVTKGTVQVIPDGSPLVLMSDAQTTGGYPRIAQVLAADLPILAQKKPGESVSFTMVSDDEAEELYLAQIRELLRLEKNLRTKLM